jgi:glucokinase
MTTKGSPAVREGKETLKHQQKIENLPRSGPSRILVGDIGATHSRLAVYSFLEGRVELLRHETYASSEHAGLKEVLASFLEAEREEVEVACLGLPAPIHSGVAFPLTNLPWKVDREEVLQAVGTDRVALINDVEASAAGIPGLSPENLVCLQAGHADPAGNRVVISIGTGLGVSALTPTGHTFATEAGHATFSPCRDPDFDLYTTLQLEYGHVSWERVASGSALPWIHALFAPEQSPRLEGSEIARRSRTDPACRQAVETFRRYIGTAAGNFALTLMASGGLYLRGGAATKVLEKASADQFLEAFRDKGRMGPLLETVPVFVVTESDLALRGAAQTAIALLESRWKQP